MNKFFAPETYQESLTIAEHYMKYLQKKVSCCFNLFKVGYNLLIFKSFFIELMKAVLSKRKQVSS